MGTTMTAVLVGEDELTLAHVGDSRAYLWRDGDLSRLTQDHSLVEELVRQGKLTPEQASEHPQRSVITRALGPEPRIEVDTQTYRARAGDVILLSSDGLTTMVDESHIAAVLRESHSLRDAGRALIDAANDAGGRDNITVVLFRLEDVGAAPTVEHDTGVHTAVEAEPAEPIDTPPPPPRAGTGPVATLDAPRTGTRQLRPVQPPAPARPRRSLRRRRLLIVGGLLLFVGLPLVLGAFAAVRSVYFVGSDDAGFVTIYRGLPYDLPLGVDLYDTNYTSSATRDRVPRERRKPVFDHKLRSRDDAYELVRDLERQQVGR
jgi:protein phosphatase